MTEITEKGSGRLKQDRPATRKQLKKATQVKKQEDAKKANRLKNKERVRQGKAQKADPGTAHKRSIWEKIAEDRVYFILREIGDTTKNIDKWQRKRTLTALLFALLGIPAGMFMHVWLYIAGPIIGFAFYKMQAKNVENFYRGWKFERALNFSKFTRLVIPYLKASGGQTALYTIFNKILKRTEDEADRRSLYQLMGEMGDNPADLKPFTDFAQRSSGTDMSYLFMSTIFDFQQSTFDTQVIDELGKMAAEDMMNAIDEIINMKLKRFGMFPTKVVMTSFILVVGLGAGLMIENFKGLDMSGGVIEPAAQAEEAASGDDNGGDTEVVIPDEDTESAVEDTEPVATETTETVDWQSQLRVIAEDASLDVGDKWQQTSRLARDYTPSEADIQAFESDLQTEYVTSLYTAKLDDDVYTLGNEFKAQVIKEYYEAAGTKDVPMYDMAMVMWTNTYATYVEDDKSNVTNEEERINDKLADATDICTIKGNGKSKMYHMPGDPSYDKTKLDNDAGDESFCTVRQALNAGFERTGDANS